MLNLALDIASKLPHHYKLCAIITCKKGRILGIGTNSYTKTHPKQGRYAKLVGQPERVYLHAELDAIIKSRTGQAHSIYIARATKEGSGNAKPCPICEIAIKEAQIKEVHYTI